jgi:hypothetical protein
LGLGEGDLSLNSSISIEFIERYIDSNWDWGKYGLSSNKNITIEIIERYIDRPWEWGYNGLSSNNLKMKVLLIHLFFI